MGASSSPETYLPVKSEAQLVSVNGFYVGRPAMFINAYT